MLVRSINWICLNWDGMGVILALTVPFMMCSAEAFNKQAHGPRRELE